MNIWIKIERITEERKQQGTAGTAGTNGSYNNVKGA
jgi:hypothetical protein